VNGTVKSAARVLEVFEYFDRIRRSATVTEVARALGYPQSSTSVLLRSLVELGYLEQDEGRRSYLPTPRVTLLGSWVEPLLAPGGEIMRLMDELGGQTGETIILGVPSGDAVRYIHVVQATNAMRLHVGNGTVRPMAISGMGRLFMSRMDEASVRRIVERHNAELAGEEGRLHLAAVRRDLASIRAEGYVPSLDRVTQGAGGISVLLPVAPHGVPMAVAIGGLSRTINDNRERFLQLIRAGIRRHLPGAAALRAA
jgi:IclR family transcriptional regulator, acetate operon repressor